MEKSQGGLGIGLSLVKWLVELHGGSVTAESAGHGCGSEFIVRLPIADGSLPIAPAVAHHQATMAPRRILVVDDNRDAATSLAMMLKLMGNEAAKAHDGIEAIEIAEQFRPDLIMLDIGMPRLNGFDTAKRIRALPWGQQVTIVALTGWGQEEDRKRSKEAGIDDHLVKPVEPSALEKMLKSWHRRPACD